MSRVLPPSPSVGVCCHVRNQGRVLGVLTVAERHFVSKKNLNPVKASVRIGMHTLRKTGYLFGIFGIMKVTRQYRMGQSTWKMRRLCTMQFRLNSFHTYIK
jgi:hypothetical protein